MPLLTLAESGYIRVQWTPLIFLMKQKQQPFLNPNYASSPWMVPYKVFIFCADCKSKIASTSCHWKMNKQLFLKKKL
jgi:hypothetical protein